MILGGDFFLKMKVTPTSPSHSPFLEQCVRVWGRILIRGGEKPSREPDPRPRATLGQVRLGWVRLGTQTLIHGIPQNQSLNHRKAESSTT